MAILKSKLIKLQESFGANKYSDETDRLKEQTVNLIKNSTNLLEQIESKDDYSEELIAEIDIFRKKLNEAASEGFLDMQKYLDIISADSISKFLVNLKNFPELKDTTFLIKNIDPVSDISKLKFFLQRVQSQLVNNEDTTEAIIKIQVLTPKVIKSLDLSNNNEEIQHKIKPDNNFNKENQIEPNISSKKESSNELYTSKIDIRNLEPLFNFAETFFVNDANLRLILTGLKQRYSSVKNIELFAPSKDSKRETIMILNTLLDNFTVEPDWTIITSHFHDTIKNYSELNLPEYQQIATKGYNQSNVTELYKIAITKAVNNKDFKAFKNLTIVGSQIFLAMMNIIHNYFNLY